ncbi:Epidermal growth factor receptor kinase substrate 8 [Orchesella cincta]|uniref:Epidermal growth factor receptor kinase substrate 8 n=1 Tax=Orchesella cincta TaxID=48709 RepID=A0A1D2NNF0_ORCCI|nr:Epidermal growth factor receptor kinase substrate 8 [Orchesella cincta]
MMDEMERFPLQLIRDPTAFTNTNPGELYNNIFAFTVHPVEMHIFQCFNISAADLVEDVKLALQGRAPPNRQRHSSQQSLPPPPVQPPPEPPHFHVTPPKDDGRDDGSSVESEGGYEREVAILNRCFDDIERFIARLQFAAAAYRELQRRRK